MSLMETREHPRHLAARYGGSDPGKGSLTVLWSRGAAPGRVTPDRRAGSGPGPVTVSPPVLACPRGLQYLKTDYKNLLLLLVYPPAEGVPAT